MVEVNADFFSVAINVSGVIQAAVSNVERTELLMLY